MEDIEKLKETFYQEADDILNNLDELLLQLENNPGDSETIDGVFRNMHTLKGSSGIFEFHSIERLSHACEDLLDFMRKEDAGEISSEKMIDTLFVGLDQIKDMLASIQSGSEPSTEYEGTVKLIRTLLPEKEVQQIQANKMRDSGINRILLLNLNPKQRSTINDRFRNNSKIYQISITLNKYCFYKGIDPLILLKNLSAGGEILYIRCSDEHLPYLDELNSAMLYFDDIWLLYSSAVESEYISDVCEFAFAVGDITLHKLTEEEMTSYISPERGETVTGTDDWGMELKDMSNNDPIGIQESVTTMSGMKSIFLDFMEESGSLLEDIESSILSLEKESHNLTIVNDIFRPFHTIKGNCGYLGIKDMGRLCHTVETILDNARNRKSAVTQAFIDLIFEVVDAVKKMRANLPWTVRDKFGLTDNELNKYPGSDPVDIKPLLQKIEMFLWSESLQKDKTELPKIGEILLASGAINEEQLNKALKLQERKLGDILVDEGIVPAEKIKVALEIQEAQKSGIKTPAVAIKVDTERIDSLVNLVGELVIAQTLISQNPAIIRLSGQNLQKDVSHLGKITREIQDLVMSIRMMPLKQTFQKMMRVVRDVAKKAGKNVDLVISGEDTELDKSVIEEISDPLVHILRNSVDHGIEPPEERMRNGKPEKGVVHLNAFHRGGSIVIEIKDDGRGICKEKVLEKAIEKGLIGSTTDITDQQIYQLIFQPGFSTAEKVTDISGRGVGMDVVRRNIEKLRGRIDIQSKEGEGTSLSIALPLTLAIIDGMVVQAGNEKYIIPTLSIEESFRPKKEEIITVQNSGRMCNLRGSLLSLVGLNELYHGKALNKDPWDALLVVVESDGMRTCIMVDELIGQQQVVIKTIGETFKNVKGIAGGAILGDGKVGLILDVRGLIELTK
ncbi:MAG: hypothetical protein A2Z47_01975 [Thermodesulfovibrio sp. RBG_19FT_COMBO_42_12]|nr:MAG: hypothetical protein A2Z47_01975 [Thermodesulfovibrio sp. RBG_19FT_COMBO_42_12]HZX49214.1 chemotaxis protein CheA [Nitrospirota bacterium]